MRDLPGLKALTYTLLLAASPLTITSAMAQDASSTWLDAINVTGTRTEKTVKDSPRSVSIIDREEIDKKPAESVAELLRDIPGVTVLTSSVAGMKRIRIRGEDSRRVTILIDGQEVTDHSTYGTPFLTDPSLVERVDVIRGPASVLYGARAIGGVINIITKKGGSKPIEAEISGSYFSGTKGWQGTGSIFGSFSGFDYRFSGSMDDHGDRELGGTKFDPAGKLQNSSFNNDDLSLHLGYRFGVTDNHYISMKAEQHRLDSESWTDPELLKPEVETNPGNAAQTRTNIINQFDLDLPKRDRKKIGIFYDGTDLNWLVKKVHLDAYYQTVDRIFTQKLGIFEEKTSVFIPFPPPGGFFDTISQLNVNNRSEDVITNYGGTAQIDLQPLPDHYLIGGVQYLADMLDTKKRTVTDVEVLLDGNPFQNVHRDTTKTDEAEILTTSFFAQDEWSLGDYWKATGGLRYYMVKSELKKSNHLTDVADSEDFKLLKSVGLTFSAIPNTTVRWLYSEGYIHPTLLQLFVPTPFGGGGTTYANPNLNPESSYNLEFGVRYNAQGLLFDAAAYRTVAEDYIARVSCTAALCPTDYDDDDHAQINADSATTWGLELSAQYKIPGTAFTPYVNGSWTKRQVEFETYKTSNTDTPLLSARYGIKYDWSMGSMIRGWADIYARSSSGVKLTELETHEYIGDTLETDELGNWTTLNLSVGLNMGEDDKYKLALHLNNLTDKQYQASFNELPAEGRNVVMTARVKF